MGDAIPLTEVSPSRNANGGGSKPNGDNGAADLDVTLNMQADRADDTVVETLLGNEADEKRKARDEAINARLLSNDFTGLTKEELEVYSKDPHWRKIRIALFAIFWIIWTALLVGAVVIVFVSPKCPPRPDVPFYQKDIVYKVLPLSFAPWKTKNNGWGHLLGIRDNLGYIKSLGASTVSFGPIFTANSKGKALYDSVGNTAVDTNIGHFDPCLTEVTKEAVKQGLKVIVETQINFASVYHPAFQAQVFGANPTSGPFVVRLASDVSSSNLKARDGNSAWRSVSSVYSNVTNLVYYSSFTQDVAEWNFSVPDALNYASSMINVLLQKDIDGILIKDASFLGECSTLATADESQATVNAAEFGDAFWSRAHPCMMDRNSSVNVVRTLATLVANRNKEEDRRKRVLLVELAGASTQADFSAFVDDGVADGAFIDTLTHLSPQPAACNVQCMRRRIESIANSAVQQTSLRFPMWQLSTPEYGRFTTRYGDASATALLTLGVFLPGGFGLYYGDEVGVADIGVTRETLNTAFFNPGFRSTMQWSSATPYAGFLAIAKPNASLDAGLVGPSIPAAYVKMNAQVQQAAGFSPSRVSLIRDLVAARRTVESAQWGSFYSLNNALIANTTSALGSTLISFVRVAVGFDPVVVLINGIGSTTADQVGTLALDSVICNVLRASAEWSNAFASNPNLFTCATGTVVYTSGSDSIKVNSVLPLSNVYVGQNLVLVLRISKASA